MTFLRKSGSLVEVSIKSLATAARCSFCSGSRSLWTNFTTTHFILRSWIKISDTVVLGIPRSASSSHTVSCWSLLIAALTGQHSKAFCLLQAFQNVDHFQQILNHLWSIYTRFQFALLSLHHPQKPSVWIIWIISMEECSNLTQTLIQICCSTRSVILNVRVTWYTGSLSGVYCSRIGIPVLSPCLPGYINVMPTVLIILTGTGLFLNRLHVPKYTE